MADFPTALTSAVDNTTDVLAKHLNNLETKVGIDASADTSSLDYKLKSTSSSNPGHKHTLANGATDLVKVSAAEINTGTDDAKFATAKAIKDSVLFNAPEGFLINGKIVPSVTSGDLTVALKGLDGNDPSATNPVYVRIGNTVRSITAALATGTYVDGTNWGNAGSAELATKEVDWFVYLWYSSISQAMHMGISRIPYGTLAGDFSSTAANEKYMESGYYVTNSETAAADPVVNIGRFAATLSAGAGYTWTVPTFTAANLIQRPIYETRKLTWLPTYGGTASMTYTSSTTGVYYIIGNRCYINVRPSGTTGGTTSYGINVSLPFTIDTYCRRACELYDSSVTSRLGYYGGDGNVLTVIQGAVGNWQLAAGKEVYIDGDYDI